MGREVCPQSQVQIQPYENEAGASKRNFAEWGPQFNRHLIHTGEGTFCAGYVAAYKLQSAMLRNFAGGRSLILWRGLIVVAGRVWTAVGVVVAAARTKIKRV